MTSVMFRNATIRIRSSFSKMVHIALFVAVAIRQVPQL